jgi:hypothetical protein
MDQATQQNAALVEQSAAAAESLRHQAQQLVDAVAVFRLAGDSVTRVAQGGRRQGAGSTAASSPPRRTAASAARAVTKPAAVGRTAHAPSTSAPSTMSSASAATRAASPARIAGAAAAAAAVAAADPAQEWESF